MKVRLPATSANLGPGFDAMGLALDLWLEVEAELSDSDSIQAAGRNAHACEDVESSLILRTYRDVCSAHGVRAPPLALQLSNGIPFGMGLGSSAAALLAGVVLASHFGELGWSAEEIVRMAATLEGHADNVAACWFGGLTLVATEGNLLQSRATVVPPQEWSALVVLPGFPVATSKARAALPEMFTRADAVYNLQRTALLVAAFAQGRGDLLRSATLDRLHQPYREQLCPLLPRLLPLADENDQVLSVTLSGAGPSVLLLVHGEANDALRERVTNLAGEPVELLPLKLSATGASAEYADRMTGQ